MFVMKEVIQIYQLLSDGTVKKGNLDFFVANFAGHNVVKFQLKSIQILHSHVLKEKKKLSTF